MNCKHVNDLLSQYAEGQLPAQVQARVAEHLQGSPACKPCAACSARLQMLRSAVALLQRDAQAGTENVPDLYAGFRQRLVTQPARSPFAPFLPSRLARQPQYALAALALCAVMGGRYYRQHRYDAVFDRAVNDLRRPIDNVHFNQDHNSIYPDGSRSASTVENWIEKGHTWSKSIYQNTARKPPQKAQPSDFVRSYTYTLPSGVSFDWYEQPWRRHDVGLSWTPSLPERPTSSFVRDVASDAARNLTRLRDTGSMQAAGIQIGSADVNGQTLSTLQIARFRQALPHDPAVFNDYPPLALCLWRDGANRLRRYQVAEQYQDGASETHDFRYGYDQHIPSTAYRGSLDMPNLPANAKIVVRDEHRVKGRFVSFNHIIHPVWLTMSDGDKQQIQNAILRWAQAWSARDEKGLRAATDLNWPLEITRADKRVGLTRSDVWQEIWANRLAKEPRWQQFTPQTMFAYQADTWPVEQSVVDFDRRDASRSLPGLNALCWIRARQTNGAPAVFPAHLFLVKRPDGYKVFQYCRSSPPLSSQQDNP